MTVPAPGASAVGNGTGLSATLSNPTGVVTGDVLVVFLAYTTGTGGVGPWVTPPAGAGWVLVGQNRTGTSSLHVAGELYVRPWHTGDATAHTFAFNSGINITWFGGITAVTGVDTTTMQDCAGTTATANPLSTVVCPAVTTVTADALLVSGCAMTSPDGMTPPAGMTEQWECLLRPAFATAGRPVAGASGTKTWTNTAATARRMVGVLGALRPGVAVPPGAVAQRWTGAAWQTATVKRWDGSAWVTATVKRWTGTSWV